MTEIQDNNVPLSKRPKRTQGWICPLVAAQITGCPYEAILAWINTGKLATRPSDNRRHCRHLVHLPDVEMLVAERQQKSLTRRKRRRISGPTQAG